jgi:serine/threonine-protein kinase
VAADDCDPDDEDAGLCEPSGALLSIFGFSCFGSTLLLVLLLLIFLREKFPNSQTLWGPFAKKIPNQLPTLQRVEVAKPVKTIRRTVTRKKKVKAKKERGNAGLPSDKLSEKFARGELIGRGGMANVYLAEDKRSGDSVVWKESAPSRFNPLKEVNRRLSEECLVLDSLDHKRIPKKIEEGELVNESGERVRVMIMEFMEGSSLNDEMKSLVLRGNALDYFDSTSVVLEVSEALEYMADQDPPLYHRDIKPANIIANPERGTVLIDFGLAKGVAAGADVSLSRGASEGWSPPERRDGVSGPFTDVYSLGQVLWHLLTGERPFHAIGEDERAILSEMGHPDWIADLLKMTSLPSKKRIQTAAEFRIRLENEGEMP